MINLGWVKLYRELKSKSIWQLSTPQQKVVLITILMTVNHEENKWEWKGEQYACKPGQLITSLNSLVKECGQGVTMQNVRTALDRFEKLGFLTNVSTKTGRLITVINWDKYQGNDFVTNKVSNKDLTKSQQRPNKELTTNKNDKNVKNEKKRVCSAITTPPTLTEIISYAKELEKDDIKYCEKFFNNYESKNWKGVTDWKAKFRYWLSQDEDRKENQEESYQIGSTKGLPRL